MGIAADEWNIGSLFCRFIEFADAKSAEEAYFKMDNVIIDDRRVKVDFSQSVSKLPQYYHAKYNAMRITSDEKKRLDQKSAGRVRDQERDYNSRSERYKDERRMERRSDNRRMERNWDDRRKVERRSDDRRRMEHKSDDRRRMEHKSDDRKRTEHHSSRGYHRYDKERDSSPRPKRNKTY